MASTSQLLIAGLFLIVNTIVIGTFILVGGPVFGYLTTFISTYPYAANNPLPPTIVQWIPGFFFTMLIILELALIIRLAFVVVNKTDYQGETEW